MNNTLQNVRPKLKALAIYQIIGGVLGIGLTLWMIDVIPVLTLVLFLILFAIALNGYSIYCGVLLLQSRNKGLAHSKINQLLQAVSFSVLGYAYQYTSGAFLFIGLDLTESMNFMFNIGTSSWKFNINSDSPAMFIKLNLVTLFLIVYIDKLRKRTEEINVEARIEAIGQLPQEQPLTSA